ncbi:SDR family oxidoreductase [Sphingobium sp. H39-3-25]|uniref:SDR family NAD(P)-dependent oxidoreductase n=1 Tax=Sphingobium arseniciresistens TaxID=3030834 RepID=UPI0023BA3902|nr:SDR family oxidoreductase [Sphingobium arseniciresistens]
MVTKNATFGLSDKLCVVTGGGSGIGRSICIALAGEGARVAVLDRDEAMASETLEQLGAARGSSMSLACDVTNSQSVEAAQATIVATAGHPDILVNNAGRLQRGALADLSIADWNDLLSVNLTGYLICSQIFGRAMLDSGSGSLVHVGSISAKQAIPFSGAYSVSKAAVTMLSTQLALEWGPRGVRSNVVHPGFIRTPLSQAAYDKPEVTAARASLVPTRRIGEPEDVTAAVLYLASPLSSYVNGAELMIDGGLSRNLMAQVQSSPSI